MDKNSVFWKPEAKPFKLMPGHHVPAPRGVELLDVMQANLRESSALLADAEARVRALQSTRDIYEDVNAPAGTTVIKATGPEGLLAMSDVQRARVEVAHWTEYLGWARSEAAKTAPDARLPVEREPGADDGDEAVA